ncbi:MAG: apolipoprotein N-acyltransferase [Nitrospinae bacterium]|nr:apolipoprotein N-acyltransferase [Nitrospinota bacterium]
MALSYNITEPGRKAPLAAGGAAIVSGAMMALAFPDFNAWPLMWAAMVPLFMALRGKSPLHGALIGFLAGVVFYGVTLRWIINTITVYGHLPLYAAIPVQVMITMAAAFYTSLFGYLFSVVESRSSEDYAFAAAPFIWVAQEFFRSNFFDLAFPWAKLAQSQAPFLTMIQMADITGEDGLTFLIVTVNIALARILVCATEQPRGGKAGFPVRWAGAATLMFAGALAYGVVKLNAPEPAGEPVRVAIIQGNIDQARKWDRSYIMPQIQIYTGRTIEAARRGATLVIWPEAAAPFYYGQEPGGDAIIDNLVKDTGAALIFGAPAYDQGPDSLVEYNRAWVVRPDGFREYYDKLRLVPFGEYVPMKRALPFIHRVVTAIGDMEPGSTVKALDAGGFKVGLQICYEVIFPQFSREIANKGAGALVNITNDSWYGVSPASRQSLAMGVFRAVENRLPLLRAAQSGVSAIVTPKGEIMAQTPLFVETTLYGSFVPAKSNGTTYSLSGDIFAWICVMVTFAFAGRHLLARQGYK